MPYTPPPAGTPEVFRFVNVRNPQLINEAKKTESLITHAFYSAVNEAGTPEPLFKALKDSLATGGTVEDIREKMHDDVIDWRERTTGNYYFSSDTALYASTSFFKNFNLIRDYLVSVQGRVTETDLIPIVEAAIGVTITTYYNDSLVRKQQMIWENLFNAHIIPDNLPLREEYVWSLKILNIIIRIHLSTTALTAVQMRKLYKATVVLPGPVFPLPKIINTITTTDTVPADPNAATKAAAKTAYENQLKALREIRNTFDKQHAKLSLTFANGCRQPIPPAPFNGAAVCGNTTVRKDDLLYFINSTNFNLLSQSTKDIINALVDADSRYIPYLLKRIRQDAMINAQKAGLALGNVAMMLVGNSLVPLRDLCTAKIERVVCNPITGADLPVGSGHVKPLGIGDYLVVKQELLKYALGEIAHIENVMFSETKTRTHRNFMRQEDTTITETEKETEEMRDVQTTERFSLESEASQVLSNDQQFNAGVSITGPAGPVQISANAGYATAQSEETSNSQSSSYAKDVTERAVNRVREKVRTLRQTTVIREIEETNVHGFNNTLTDPPAHSVGQYHWVDKYYLCKTLNRGKRMMFEFMVPEPAALYIYSQANNKPAGSVIEKPIAPDDSSWGLELLRSPEDINADNYDLWTARYAAPDVPAPPNGHVVVGKAIKVDITEANDTYVTAAEVLALPDGYKAVSARVRYTISIGEQATYIKIQVGNQDILSTLADDQDSATLERTLMGEVKELPLSVLVFNTYAIVNIEVICEPTSLTMDEWKLAAYSAIKLAYQRKLDEFNRAAGDASFGAIQGKNPVRNREIEKEELKRSCLELFTDQKWKTFNATDQHDTDFMYPEFRNPEAREEGNYVKFFEQAFEWNQISYLFYPYFWGRKQNWITIKGMEDPDPTFTKFLQSGYARVVVPVRPGFEEALLHYSESGNIWNGDAVPTIDDPLYVSMIQEIKDAQEIVLDEDVEVVGEPWIIKVPTNLVKLAASLTPELPDNSEELID